MPELSKAEVAYQSKPHDGDRCGLCSMYRAPRKCTLVRGDIAPTGWCKKFEPMEA